MKMSEKNELVAKAVVDALSEIGNTKNTTINPFFKKKYTPLHELIDASRTILKSHGLVAIQDVSNSDNGIIIKTMLIHESGQWMEQEGVDIPLEKKTAQGAGIAITYGRRYTLAAMLGISSEDDTDGNQTSQPRHDQLDIAPLQKMIADAKNVDHLTPVQKKLTEAKPKLTDSQVKTLAKMYSDKMSALIKENFDGEVVS